MWRETKIETAETAETATAARIGREIGVTTLEIEAKGLQIASEN